MNSDQLLAHFSRITDAPDAIPRLRGFILNLAIRGKLIEQDPDDEPASELLNRIRSEKARLTKAGEIRRQAPQARIKPDETPFEVPRSWVLVRLGDVIHLVSGQHLQPNEYSDRKEFGPPYITGPADFGVKGLEITRYALVRKVVAVKGQILLTVKGAGVGKTALCNLQEVAISRQLMALTAIAWSQSFLLLVTHRLAEALKESARSLIPGISREDVEEFVFPLPPLAEQHRIVEKVDELMALCDGLESAQQERESRRDRLTSASLHRLNHSSNEDPTAFRKHASFYLEHLARTTTRPEQIKQLRQTILNLALLGQLVPQDVNDEPASRLVTRIHVEKALLMKSGFVRRLLPTSPVKSDKLPATIPDNWIWVRIGNILLGDSQNGYSKKPDDAPDGVPILRISAGTLRKDGIVAEEEHKLISGISTKQQELYELQPGDLLACRFNGNRSFVGRLSLYLGYLGIRPIYPDKLIRLRLVPELVLPQLIRYFAESSVVRRDIEGFCATTVGNWGISASNLKEVRIPLPPIAEQHRILARIDELLSLCDRMETQLTTTQTESRRLLEAVLHEALNPAALEIA
jgi:type I restriction enzyme S subunit